MQEATFRMWISFCFSTNTQHWRGWRATGKSVGNKPMCILAGSRFTHTYCEKVWDNKGKAKTDELLVNKAHELFSYKRVGGHFISLQRLEPEVSWFQDVVVHIYSRGGAAVPLCTEELVLSFHVGLGIEVRSSSLAEEPLNTLSTSPALSLVLL